MATLAFYTQLCISIDSSNNLKSKELENLKKAIQNHVDFGKKLVVFSKSEPSAFMTALKAGSEYILAICFKKNYPATQATLFCVTIKTIFSSRKTIFSGFFLLVIIFSLNDLAGNLKYNHKIILWFIEFRQRVCSQSFLSWYG